MGETFLRKWSKKQHSKENSKEGGSP